MPPRKSAKGANMTMRAGEHGRRRLAHATGRLLLFFAA
jgi:hypothetical protein